MAARIPHAYGHDELENHAVIAKDGEIVSHATTVPQSRARGSEETVECWGISGVATAKQHRGNGHMSLLLEFWIDRMLDSVVAMSQLS